jgi:type II secretory pathway component GspD/PulD (secretin)
MQNKKIRFATMALAMAMPILVTASGQIEGIAVQKYRKGVEVQIEGKGLIEPAGSFLNSNTLYTLEFDAKLAQKSEKMQIWQNGLQTIQVTQIGQSSRVRIQFRFQAGMKAEVTKTESGFSINFDPIELTESGLGSFVKKLEAKKEVLPNAAQPFLLDEIVAKAHTKKTEARPAEKKKTPVVEAPTKPEKLVQDGRVSLDFVDTNVVFILKSLAKQTGSNIVTSPDVSGKLTVKLDSVTVKEALTLVTSLTGLRFAQVGRTYVVTTNSKFLETLKSVQGGREESTLSRVVPIFSGQGNQIKVAVLKSVSSENAYGRFELVLPSEKAVVASNQKVSKDGTKDGEDKDATQVSMTSDVDAKDTYMMVIGNPARLDEIEQLIRGIDRQLCNAIGVRVPENNTPVIETYSVHGGRAIDLVEAVVGKGKTGIGSVELFATPTNSIAKQTIVLKGREDEVRNVLRALEQLDSDEALTQKEFRTIDLQFTDPRAMRELIISQVPGVSCVIAPNGVMNPMAYMQEQLRMQSEQRGTDQPAPQGGGTAMASGNQNAMMMGGGMGMGGQGMGGQGAAGGAGGQGGVTKDSADTGIILPFQGLEPTAFPMKLILRGSQDQVAAALDLVNKTDVAPRQVSLEMRVMEISREELLRLGIDWNLFTSGAIKTISLKNPATSPSNRIGISVQGRDVSGDVGATLDSISNGNRLVSRPNLICTDGRGNEIFVGDAIRYIESIQSTQNGVSVSSGTVRAGVRLAAFPRLGGDGAINLDLRTAVTYLKGFKQVPQIGGELPQTSERVGQSTITLRDGETFAIGGLIQEQDRKELSGLPILKDLPFLGQFFRRTSTDKVKTELVIFVTAKSVKVNQPTETKTLPMAPDSDILRNKENLKPSMKMPPMAASKDQTKSETKKKGGKG